MRVRPIMVLVIFWIDVSIYFQILLFYRNQKRHFNMILINDILLMKLPWSKDKECEHLVKYQGTSIDIDGVTVPNIFSLGNVSIKPQVLQAAEKAIQFLDMNYFQNCKTLKLAPTKESETKYFEQMTKQQEKLNDIAMAIAAYDTNTNSQVLEETLSNILKSHLELPESNKKDIKKSLEVDVSVRDIETGGSVRGAKIKNIKQGTVKAGVEKVKANGDVTGAEIDSIGFD